MTFDTPKISATSPDTFNLSENNGKLSPVCFTFGTPELSNDNFSYSSECNSYWNERLSLSHYSYERIPEKRRLNPEASPFIPIRIDSEIPMGKYMDHKIPLIQYSKIFD